MKRALLIITSVLFSVITFAQSVPQGINYQAIARDSTGNQLENDTLTVRFSVLSDSTTGSVSWQETHGVTTSDYGLFTAVIGEGTKTGGSSVTFDAIDWGSSTHSLKVEIMMQTSGTYIDMGTTEFMSVPYSLHAKTAANGSTTDELQSLSISGDTLFISSGNYIVLPASTLLGCTDSTSSNYNALANTDDGSCCIDGCIDATAYNYNSSATCDDGSCIAVALGCIDSTAFNYDSLANTDDGSCIAVALGCIDSTAFNYDSLANTDDGSCIAVVLGCIDSTAFNYNASANTDDGSCASAIGDYYQGGVIIWLNPNDNTHGLVCDIKDLGTAEWGCAGVNISGADLTAINTGYQNTIDIVSGCQITGIAADLCINSTAQGYSDWFLPSKDECYEMYLNKAIINITANANGGDPFASDWYWSSSEYNLNYAWKQNFSNGLQYNDYKVYAFYVRAIRAFGAIYGCTDPTAFNYNVLANTDDGSCIAVVLGCMDSTAFNYNVLANTDDGSCVAVVLGCMDPTAFNYNVLANTDDGSCIACIYGCTDTTALNYNSSANCDDGSCIAVVLGCMDPTAFNYNALANTDDGSCVDTINTFSYTGSVQTFTVPAGVTSISVDAYGASGTTAQGGYGGNTNLGKGGRVEATLTVSPGEVLNIYVGGSSHYAGYSSQIVPGWNGGGANALGIFVCCSFAGGGATDIRIGGTILTDRVLVVGGGGGRPNGGTTGGHGGGLTGQTGGSDGGSAVGGTGGTQTSGGSIGGTLGVGGNGIPSSMTPGGGGGGGYYGGGGGSGGSYPDSAGGGGGSSYTHPTLCSSVVHTQGVQTGAGHLTITLQ